MLRAWWGRIWLYCLSYFPMTALACLVVENHSALRTSPLSVPLKRSLQPFSQGEPGYMWIGVMPARLSQS